MSNQKFMIVLGQFICKTCKKDVDSARFWHENGEVTWMCVDKHISKVGLIPHKKKKKDFVDE